MIRQYKLREIKKNPALHKEVFVLQWEAIEMLQKFIEATVMAGVSKDKLMEIVSDE